MGGLHTPAIYNITKKSTTRYGPQKNVNDGENVLKGISMIFMPIDFLLFISSVLNVGLQ